MDKLRCFMRELSHVKAGYEDYMTQAHYYRHNDMGVMANEYLTLAEAEITEYIQIYALCNRYVRHLETTGKDVTMHKCIIEFYTEDYNMNVKDMKQRITTHKSN